MKGLVEVLQKTETSRREGAIKKANPAGLGSRGRIFKGVVTKLFPTRCVIEFERTVYVPKYERYYKKKTKLHARLSPTIPIQIGDLIKIQETRPLTKIIHFIVIENLSKEAKK